MRSQFVKLLILSTLIIAGTKTSSASDPLCRKVLKMNGPELSTLIHRAFAPTGPSTITLLVDLPPVASAAHAAWSKRLKMVKEWGELLQAERPQDTIQIIAYSVVPENNAPLPTQGWKIPLGANLPESQEEAAKFSIVPMDEILKTSDIILALTQKSATAPLKLAAKVHPFKAATSGGFTEEMIPALKLPFPEVHAKCQKIADVLEGASAAEIRFQVKNPDQSTSDYSLKVDLRFRKPTVSSGIIHQPGTAANSPSGEVYIPPYEGEKEGIPSLTKGMIPVQFGNEIVLYRVEKNRIIEIIGTGNKAAELRARLIEEPLRGNIAELGFGVLETFGITPIGVILLDEKLGFHIGESMSKHLGGSVGPEHFNDPARASHEDRVYISSLQPHITIQAVIIQHPEKPDFTLIQNGQYTLFNDHHE